MYSHENLALPKEEFEEPKTINEKTKPRETERINRPGVNFVFYYENLDLLVSGYEDSRICIWGYNEESIQFVPDNIVDFDAGVAGEGVTNRVAGMSLKATLLEHKEAITSMTCFKSNQKHWMLSTGWDRRICIWDLSTLKLHDVFRNRGAGYSKEELAADGIILSIDYNPDNNEFGYASSDKQAYIRRFSPDGSDMRLLAVLQGHEAEVSVIKWHHSKRHWITGSEDRTIRIWGDGGLTCISVINNDGPVTALCIDSINGCVISGSQDKVIRVFDLDKKNEIIQKNTGHTDEIRSLMHIPARNQVAFANKYVSGSWDNTVRFWNAYLKKGQRRIQNIEAIAQAAEQQNSMQQDSMQPEAQAAYSDLNPLLMPKLLAKSVFAKEFMTEKPVANDDDYTTVQAEKTVLEEELRQTLNDLDIALNQPEQKLAKYKKTRAKK